MKNSDLPEKVIGRDLIFFDGECVLCDGLVKKALIADEDAHFLLGAIQSETARKVLEPHGINTKDLSTVYVVKNCGTDEEQILTRSTAVIYALSKFRRYGILGKVLSLFPKFIRDFGYKIVAANRYQVFGKNETCLVPTPEYRARLID
ncbi:MAG TPA: DCC1-like thiol-disulfide oxidoreductase family protein [Pseudobdellovibrionaceae bacterium]|nr:DCC1-like thiol-disulfide oxidoreductase family protein [Pseudobdellovibrionaceae bacterium]